MVEAPGGTDVGVDDPYDHVDRCDFLAADGRCRFAREHGERDPSFAADRRDDGFRCPVAGDPRESGPTGPWSWADCPHFRCRTHERECARCGLAGRPSPDAEERPLLEEHHLSYDRDADGSDPATASDGDRPGHEITVVLCRWCHATVHDSWGRIDDDVNPDPDAIAALERRKSLEADELDFETAAEREEW